MSETAKANKTEGSAKEAKSTGENSGAQASQNAATSAAQQVTSFTQTAAPQARIQPATSHVTNAVEKGGRFIGLGGKIVDANGKEVK